MIHSADIREWRNHSVVDPKGHKIGVLEAIYVDTTTDEPAMATVRTGLPTRHQLAFVPLDEAILGPDYVKVYAVNRWLTCEEAARLHPRAKRAEPFSSVGESAARRIDLLRRAGAT